MHFPQHWAKATWRGTDADGNAIDHEAWGWSDTNREDAHRHAEQRARQIGESQRGGHPSGSYGYPNRPLREPILRQLAEGTTGAQAIITRNSYGCDVLNTDRIVFIDVDLPPRPAPGFFASLFGGKKSADDALIRAEAGKVALLENWQRRHPDVSFRVYRTAAGLRYLLTSALYGPDDPLIDDLMEATGADAEYRRLCRQQKKFPGAPHPQAVALWCAQAAASLSVRRRAPGRRDGEMARHLSTRCHRARRLPAPHGGRNRADRRGPRAHSRRARPTHPPRRRFATRLTSEADSTRLSAPPKNSRAGSL